MKKWLLRIGIVGISIAPLAMIFVPEVRTAIREPFTKDYRSVLSKARATPNNSDGYSFVKIKTQDGITVEVYEEDHQRTKLLEKWEFKGHKDAFFTFNGESTNLAIDDTDDNGRPEVLIPTINSSMTAHLSVYEWDAALSRFVLTEPIAQP